MTITNELWVAYVRIFFVELAYWVISIGMVFVNKVILLEHIVVFITIFQISVSLSILVSLNYLTKSCIDSPKTKGNLIVKLKDNALSTKLIDDDALNNNLLDGTNSTNCQDAKSRYDSTTDNESLITLLKVNIPQRLNIETFRVVFPLSVLYIGMLLLNNLCLRYVDVAFYFVSRSLTTVFNVAFTYLLINEPISKGSLVCCAFIVFGFILGIDQESLVGSLSVIGVVFGVGSSLFLSLFTIYTKKTLAKLEQNVSILILYNNINAIFLCLPLLLVHGDIQALVSNKMQVSTSFWLYLSLSGVMAYFISVATNASIKYTSPLTHNISGTAKACLQTVIAVIYLKQHKSVLWYLSNLTILVASAAYSRIRQIEMEQSISRLDKNVKCSFDQDDGSSLGKESNSETISLTSACCDTTTDKNCCSVELKTC